MALAIAEVWVILQVKVIYLKDFQGKCDLCLSLIMKSSRQAVFMENTGNEILR